MYIRPAEGQKMPRLWRASEKILAGGVGFKATFEGKKCTDLKGLDAPQQISKGWRIARGLIRATGIAPLVALIVRNVYRNIYGIGDAKKNLKREFVGDLTVRDTLLKKIPDLPDGLFLIKENAIDADIGRALDSVREYQTKKMIVYYVQVVKEGVKPPEIASPSLKDGVRIEPIVVIRRKNGDLEVKKGPVKPVPNII